MLVAAAATGMLAGQCVRQRRIEFDLWTAATLGLTVALAAQSMGFARGFGATTFRDVQLFALLLAPLWLAWGLVEAVARSDAARFGARLISSALMVVASVILLTDPLNPSPFSKSWPSAALHFQPVAVYALDAVQVVAVATAVAATGLAAARARRDPRWRPALIGVASVGLAVLMTVGLRLSLPVKSVYPLFSMMAAVLVWFGATRTQQLPARDAARDPSAREAGAPAGLPDLKPVTGPTGTAASSRTTEPPAVPVASTRLTGIPDPGARAGRSGQAARQDQGAFRAPAPRMALTSAGARILGRRHRRLRRRTGTAPPGQERLRRTTGGQPRQKHG